MSISRRDSRSKNLGASEPKGATERKPEGALSERRITRRGLLVGAAAGLGALGPISAARAEVVEYAEDPGGWVAGVVASVELPNVLRIAGPQDPQTVDDTVRFSEDAAFWRDRPATLADFRTGDDVFVEGRWADGVFLGTYLTSLSWRLDGSIVAVDAPRIETTGGAIRLIPESRWYVDENPYGREVRLEDSVVGVNIWATGRIDRNTDELVAHMLGKK